MNRKTFKKNKGEKSFYKTASSLIRSLAVAMLFLLLICGQNSKGQTAASYGFSAFTRYYDTAVWNGPSGSVTSVIVYSGITGNNLIGDITSSLSVPFYFTFCGVTYSHIYICSNGFISFSNDTSVPYTNLADSITGAGMLMPYWDHLKGMTISGGSYTNNEIRACDSGYAPYRVFKIDYGANWYPFSYPSSGTAGRFQVRLYETSNIIEFAYHNSSAANTRFTGTTATIGIANSSTDWQVLNNSGSSPVPSSTTFTDTISTGPVQDQVYRWDPTPCSGTPSGGTLTASIISACAPYPVTLTASGAGGVGYGITYQWQSSPDSISWSTVSGATSTTASVSVTGTKYYRLSATCTISGLTGYSAGLKLQPLAAPSVITGPSTLCAGSATTFTDSVSGGTWSSTFSSVATIGSSTGVVNPLSGGITVISYTLPTGCSIAKTITVNAITPISGTSNACTGATTPYTNGVAGGIWSSSDTTVATIGSSSGLLTGILSGTVTLTYSLPSGCSVTRPVTVNTSPRAISVPSLLCMGGTYTVTDSTTGGTWNSSNPSVAALAVAGTYTASLSAVSPGTAILSYTVPSGCIATRSVTVMAVPAAIGGTAVVCAGMSSTLTDATPGGLWSSGSTNVTAGSLSGLITGVTTGTAVISYTLSSGCAATITATVPVSPSAISGSPDVCLGLTSLLANSLSGGIWTSSDLLTADVTSTGLVTGLALGGATITYLIPSSGCYTTLSVAVHSAPVAIAGTSTNCVGATAALIDLVSGGTWSSSDTSVAIINAATGIYTGTGAGTATMSYSTGPGCTVSMMVTVSPSPAPIGGASSLCAGSTTTFTDATAGGTWSCASPLATISSGGLITAMSAGTVQITYTSGIGCSVYKTITINPLPGPVSGPSAVCEGSIITLTNTGGGIWSTATTNFTIGSSSGSVTGVTAGTGTVAYTLPVTGCGITFPITVNAAPAAIGGPGTVCVGATVTQTDATAGGTWSKSNTNVTIGSTTGVLTGVISGTSVVTYTTGATGCKATRTVTVFGTPGIIGGPSGVCVGGSITATCTGTGTWSSASSTLSIGTITGVVNGASAGTGTITFTATATGCYSVKTITINALPTAYAITGGGSYCAGSTGLHVGLSGSQSGTSYQLSIGGVPGISITGPATDFGVQTTAGTYTVTATSAAGCSGPMTGSATITVNPLPAAIGGPSAVCTGASVSLTDATSGGTWSATGGTGSATLVPATGVVSGISTGTVFITYTLPTTCYTTTTVTVSSGPGAITGAATVCAGATTTLTNTVSGGTWSSSASGIAAAGSFTGLITGIAAGTSTITYSLGGICTALKIVTVNPGPAAIAGVSTLCAGTTTTFTDATPGGIWSTSGSAATIIPTTGLTTGVTADTVTIRYTAGGCTATKLLSVNAAPSAISGPAGVCTGSNATYTNTAGGGVWSAGTGIVNIGSGTGTVTGLAAGPASITYNTGGCTATRTISVYPVPAITGSAGICTGTTTTLSATLPGGTWGTTATAVTVGAASGLVTGIAAGTATVSYSTTAGCTTTVNVTVSTGPTTIGGGGTILCNGATTTLTNGAPGGIWSTSASAVSIGSLTGVVTGLTTGTALITYSLGSGCQTTTTLTVNAAPAAIKGGVPVCAGSSITLTSATTGGIWSTAGSAATIVPTTGVVTGIAAGTATITYTAAGCTATTTVTVNAQPVAIAGSSTLCTSSSTTFTDASTGGIWSTTSAVVAAGSADGIITGIAAGTATITYTLPTGCTTTKPITVSATPAPITGAFTICIGSTTTLTDVTAGGTWSTASANVTVGSAGTVTGVSSGTAAISYSTGGCASVATVTVTTLPASITGNSDLCLTYNYLFADTTSGGIWSSSNGLIAAVVSGGTAAGTVTGMAAGTATITYSLGAGCTVTKPVTVHALPLPVTGSSNVCLGSSTTLSDATPGGVWSSSNNATATITSGGVVSGVSSGTATMSYTVAAYGGCAAIRNITVLRVPDIMLVHPLCAWGDTMTVRDSATTGIYTSSLVTVTNLGGGMALVRGNAPGNASITYILPSGCSATATFTVNPLPGLITGAGPLCPGTSLLLTNGTSGGTWSSRDTTVVTIGATSGIATAAGAGTAMQRYTLIATGCHVDTPLVVTPMPEAGTITGAGSLCTGNWLSLSDTAAGGVWSHTGTATTVSGAGVVTAVTAGIDIISYRVTNICGTDVATTTVTVNARPDAGSIAGRDSTCIGISVLLTDTATGGVWSATNGLATVSVTGLVTGVAQGYDTIQYTVSNAWCSSTTIYRVKILSLAECPTLATKGTKEQEQFLVWPNPTEGLLQVKTAVPGELVLISQLGQRLQTFRLQPGTTPLQLPQGLSSGIYVLEFNTLAGERQLVRLVVE